VTLTPATAQVLRNNAYNFTACASILGLIMDQHAGASSNTLEMRNQIKLAAMAGIETVNWLHLSKDGDALDPPGKKFTQAQLMDDYGVARSKEAIAHLQKQVQIGGPRYAAQIVNLCVDVVFPQYLPEGIKLLKAVEKPQQP
jgi:hypothetical protein